MGRVFVAGGTGFVGRQFVATALEAGLDLCVLTRQPEARTRLEALGVTVVEGDLQQPGRWQEEARQADMAVYIAGPPAWGRRLSTKVAREYERGMTEMTRGFFESLDPGKLRKVVYVAGASLYGDTGETPATEDQTAVPKGTGPYIEPAVLLAESYGERGYPVVMTLPGAVYGPGSWLEQLILWPLHRKKPVYSVRGYDPAISLIHREDAARALVHLLEHGEPNQRYFIADDEPATLGRILEAASRVTGIPYKERPLPEWICKLAIGPILVDAAKGNAVVSNAKLKATGFELTYPSLDEGLRPVIKEWRALKRAERDRRKGR